MPTNVQMQAVSALPPPTSNLHSSAPRRAAAWLAAALVICAAHDMSADETTSSRRPLAPVTGPPGAAALISVSPKGEVLFAIERGMRRMTLGELLRWGAPAQPRAMAQLLLADGGVITLANNAAPTIEQDHLVAVSETFGEFKLPLRSLAGLLLHAPIDPQTRDRLANLVRLGPTVGKAAGGGAHDRDWLFLENGDQLQGRIAALTERAVEFEADIGPLTVELDSVLALAFQPTLAAESSAAPRTFVGFADGSLVAAASIAINERRAELTLAGGERLAAPDAEPVLLQPLVGQVDYLSDLAPASDRHIPYLSVPGEYRLDVNVAGTRLRAGGELYLKGVGMRSAARLTWQLDKAYRRFEAELAIDDQTRRRGSVVFRVFSGSREIHKSRVVRGGDEPLPISVDIRDVRQLSLVVDYADRADVLDHANWLNARLVP